MTRSKLQLGRYRTWVFLFALLVALVALPPTQNLHGYTTLEYSSGNVLAKNKNNTTNSVYNNQGCSVCTTPNVISSAKLLHKQAPERVCQEFWHKKYQNWEECRLAALSMQRQFRNKLCELCQQSPSQPNRSSQDKPKRGIVYGISGSAPKPYVLQTQRGIRVLRSSHIGYEGPIEVYVDSPTGVELCQSAMEGIPNVRCIPMQPIPVGFNAKLMAVLETTLDQVIMIDTDNVLIRHPDKVFAALDERPEPLILWPDLWGQDCQQFLWAKDENNPTGIMLAGQSAWPEHVLWPTMDVDWQAVPQFSQATGNSITLIDRTYPGILKAYELTVWMAEQEFFQKVLYGEKDCLRAALLALNIPFHMVPELPWELGTPDNGGFYRHHLMALWKGAPITLDLVKGTDTCCNMQADTIAKVVAPPNSAGSLCIHSSYSHAFPNDERLNIQNATENPLARQWLDIVNSFSVKV